MELLENPTVKIKYQKCKLRVKRWESDFMEKYGRRPNKNDIKKADSTIKESYKMYWKLKTKALEETLLDITFTDDMQANVSANSSLMDCSSLLDATLNNTLDISTKSDTDEIPPAPAGVETSLKNMENIDPIKSPLKNSLTAALCSPLPPEPSPSKPEVSNVDGAWGEHLNKSKDSPKKTEKILVGRSSSFQLSQKKFSSGTFDKRNPRKSLSLAKMKSKTDSKSALDKTENPSVNTQDTDKNEPDSTIFGDSVKITHMESKVSAQPVNPIRRMLTGGPTIADRKLNTGWLDRCGKEVGLEPLPVNSQRLSGISDSGVESMDTSIFSPPTSNSAENSAQISDDEFVCNSDSEEENRKRVRNWRKTMSDGVLPQFKRQCLGSSPDMVGATKFSNQMPPNPQGIGHLPMMNPVSTQKLDESRMSNERKSTEVKLTEKQVSKDADSEKTTVKSSPEPVPKKKVTRRSRKVESDDDDDDDENYKEDKPKTRKTRVARKKPVSRKSAETSAKKPRAATKRTTRSKKKVPSDDEEVENATDRAEEPKNPQEVPIYGVEALEVVPRFAVPRESQGDLIQEFSQTVEESTTDAVAKKPKSQMTAKEKLEAKIAAGSLNENFVRINLKKKVFVRGKRSFNFSRYKKGLWKQRKKELSAAEQELELAEFVEKAECFKCGEKGHIARRCPSAKSDDLIPLEEIGEDESEFPTLEEVEKMASEEAVRAHANRINLLPKCPSMVQGTSKFSEKISKNADGIPENSEGATNDSDEEDYYFEDEDFEEDFQAPSMQGHKIPEELVARLLPPVNGAIEPVYSTNSGELIPTPKEVFDTLKKFGHQNFRPGQEKAVMRILSGQSTLVTLSTGSGKSLCYQLPAYLYAKRSHCITLVISPLVSLMDDQVTGIPHFLSAAALHTGQTQGVRDKIMEAVRKGDLDILLVSPEAVVAGERSTGFGSLLRQLPPIAFACIDEAHCISQWSHNFRPSYLMICRVLLEKLGVKTILGLTATATRSNAESIVEHLRIHDGMSGVISDTPMPNNLTLTVSKDERRDQALISLLRSERFHSCDSIIVYCTRREECLRIAGTLRVSLQDTVDPDKPKPKNKVSQIAEAYHAGIAPSRRKVIQRAFMKGDTRIVVATVAFGMGINKPDIRSVIHYNMPNSFEGYVQEVGRAGRDNLPAHCHLFLSPDQDSDKWELRRHVYQDGVDRHTIRKLLQRVFLPCSCANTGKRCPGHEVAFSINETVSALDISEETISTLLCYLELHPKKFITVLSSVYVNAKVSSYNGPKALKAAAQSSPPLAMAIALDQKRGISHENSSVIEFPVVDVAAAIGWDSGVVKNHLKNLEWITTDGRSKRSAISVKYDTLGLRVRAPGDLSDAELDEALEALYERTQSRESSSLWQLEAIHAALDKIACNSVHQCMEMTPDNMSKSEQLKVTIREYFQSASPQNIIHVPKSETKVPNESEIISDIRSLISSYRDNNFTGRAIARILHGIQSPNYAALNWSRCRFWRAHLKTDFNYILQLATKEILAMR